MRRNDVTGAVPGRDREGILDHYIYRYDPAGNRTAIENTEGGWSMRAATTPTGMMHWEGLPK